MYRIDLHTHSTASDGSLTPKELIILAKDRDIKAIALSDHDTLAGLSEAKEMCEKVGIELINAVELSAHVENLEIHILGYFFHDELEELNQHLVILQEIRNTRNKEMIKRFNQRGIAITYEELSHNAKNSVITRGHFAKLLIEKKYAENSQQAFKKYLLSNCETYVQREKQDSLKTIGLIKSFKGIPVLAHPFLYGLNNTQIENLVLKLKNDGLEGIEAIYSSYNKIQEDFLKNLAIKYNLKITGGSDFHGSIKPHINLGDGTEKTMIPYKILENLR